MWCLRHRYRSFAVTSRPTSSIHIACIDKDWATICSNREGVYGDSPCLWKVYQYILGWDVIKVETDHKPLIPIFKKPSLSASKRLQRILLHLQKHHLNITYLSGKQIYIVDMLSRAYLPHTHSNQTDVFRELKTINQAQDVRVSETTFWQLRTATSKD